jgi:hypothetical protein
MMPIQLYCPSDAPRISDEYDPLLEALRREHGPDGRPDVAPQLRHARPDLWRDCMVQSSPTESNRSQK